MGAGPQVQLSGGDHGAERLSATARALYTPIDQLRFRQSAELLVREVIQFARPSPEILARLANQPLVLWRAVATPNHELSRYLALVRAAGSSPLILETRQDWFTPAINPSKRALVKLPVVVGQDRHGAPRVRSVKVAPLFLPGKRRIADVTCFDGTSLIAFHHDLCRLVTVFEPLARVMDARLLDGGDRPKAAYERAFALFTCMGGLVESFVWEGPEKAFTEDVVLPAFEATIRRFGVKPRIVRLLPDGTEADPFWESYPAEVMPFAQHAARRCTQS